MIAAFRTAQHPENADNCSHTITVTYPHFPFPPYTPLYPSHDHVKTYFRNFATYFELYPYIRFNHSLESAYWVGNVPKGFWELSISTSGPPEEIEIPNEPSTCGTPSQAIRSFGCSEWTQSLPQAPNVGGWLYRKPVVAERKRSQDHSLDLFPGTGGICRKSYPGSRRWWKRDGHRHPI